MKKYGFFVLLMFSIFSASAGAENCATLDQNLNIQAACISANNSFYSATLLAVQTPEGGVFWTFSDGAIEVGETEDCAVVDDKFGISFSCLDAFGRPLEVELAARLALPAPGEVIWELASFRDKDAAPESKWTTYSHPCAENRTDAFWWDDDSTVWVGCGTGLSGLGLWKSMDGGETWAAATTSPNGFFETWRVNDIRRSDDGLLYVAGIDTASSRAVVNLDTSVTPHAVKDEVFTRGSSVSLSFQVEHFVRDSTGRAFGDSLTGHGSIFREADGDDWQGLDGSWADDGSSHQILGLTLFDDAFYGAGSTISEPPFVFLPSLTGGPSALTPVQLVSGIHNFDGEMWGITVIDEKKVVAAGVNQDRDVGMIFASRTDPYDSGDYVAFDVSTLFPDDSSWMRGVCSSVDTVVAVGEKQPLRTGSGIVLLSRDGGLTFEDITDKEISANSVSRCRVLSDGTVAVAGEGGYVGLYRE